MKKRNHLKPSPIFVVMPNLTEKEFDINSIKSSKWVNSHPQKFVEQLAHNYQLAKEIEQ